MSDKTDPDPITRAALLLQSYAQARGDGLHPRLAEALRKKGHVSGPPAKPNLEPDNVVRPDFKSQTKPPHQRVAPKTSSS